MTESSQRTFSIRIFVPGGDPDGPRLVEKRNWTGVGVVIGRNSNGRETWKTEDGRTLKQVQASS